MKVAVQDAAALRALKPLEVAAYLRAKGWKREADLGGRGSLWVLGVDFDLALPAKRELGDYELRMAEVLRTLADAEGRSQLELLIDLQTTTADLIRVRAPRPSGDGSTLPLDEAVAFVGHSRDMVLAAACAAIDRRPVYAKRKAQRAMEYLGRVRMGQTERGSYVLTILSPVLPELAPAQGALIGVELEDPYERLVTRTLMGSLNALDEAARKAVVLGNMTPFQEAVEKGVSANLCEAVAGLSSAGSDDGLEIQVSWSRTRPVRHEPSRVLLSSDTIPLIVEAARQFRETAPFEDIEIAGVVTRLVRAANETEGEITITGSIQRTIRRVTLRLSGEVYGRAIQAHKDKRTVICTGDLVKEGNIYRLENPHDFTVLEADEAS